MSGERDLEKPLEITIVEFQPSGGMFQFAFQFAAALAKAGHRVTLLTGPEPELQEAPPGLSVISRFPTWHPTGRDGGGILRRKLRRAWRAAILAESWRRALIDLRRNRPQIAQFGELRYLLDSLALRMVARLTSSAIVDVAHNPLPYNVHDANRSVQKNGGFTGRSLAQAYRACDLILTLGEGPRQTLLEAFPDITEVAVCGHGDYAGLSMASVTGAPPSEAPPHALLFGAWTRYKNIPLLLDAFELVRKALPDAQLTLAGPVMPDVDLPSIEARAAQVGHVNLLAEYVEMEALPELFERHRVVVFPYATVNISGSVHMAYTFGRPVVATDVGSMADAVVDGVTGRLVDLSAEAIASAMIEFLSDPASADRMGAQAALHSQQAASWSGVAEKASAAYRRVLARSD